MIWNANLDLYEHMYTYVGRTCTHLRLATELRVSMTMQYSYLNDNLTFHGRGKGSG